MGQQEENDRLTNGMKELLLSLEEDTLKAFLGTVTGRLVRYGSVPVDANGRPSMDAKTHAIQTILMYSEPYGLLCRQKMTREVMSKYLNQKQVRMTEPYSKKTLIGDILRHWGVETPTNLTVRDYEAPNRSQNAIKNEPSSQSQSQVPLGSSPAQTVRAPNSATTATASEIQVHQNSVGGVNSGGISSALANNNHVETMECESYASIQRQEAQVGMTLGKEFSSWFYERLNTLCDFTPSHFWQESNLRLEMILAAFAENTIIEEIVGSGEACCAKLKDLVGVKQLLFNPNFDSGVRGYLNPHGLAQVMVCGQLHYKVSGEPVGVFEQMFGLMKDPRAGNTFKIKFSVLRLREGGHLALQDRPPEILDSSLVGIIEEVD